MAELTTTERDYVRLARAIYLIAQEHSYTRGQVIDWLDDDAYYWPRGLEAEWNRYEELPFGAP